MEERTSDHNRVEIKVLPMEVELYANPVILMMNFKGGKRAEAAQWADEVKKMLIGILESFRGLENFMNQTEQGKRLFLEDQEVKISDEKMSWVMTYMIDNGILRIFACLEKISQVVRCYFEHPSHGQLRASSCKQCKHEEPLSEQNCNFGKLLNAFVLREKDGLSVNDMHDKIVVAIRSLDCLPHIQSLRPFRNGFSHCESKIDQTIGIQPKVSVGRNGEAEETSFSFGQRLPSVNWFRVEIANANNAIVDSLAEIYPIIFPADFHLHVKKEEHPKI